MLVFETMLVPAAVQAGMRVPPSDQLDKPTNGCAEGDEPGYDREKYPHFFVFCQLQLARRITDFTEHWDNAYVIAKIPEEELKLMTLEDFLAKGLRYAQ